MPARLLPMSTAVSSRISKPGRNSATCRFIAGKGNADKQAVIAAVKGRGFTPVDDNEADAIAILLWAIDNYGGAS